MKSIISILLCITLPFIIYGEKTSKHHRNEVALLNGMARSRLNINEVLHLKVDGLLDEDAAGFVYEGSYMFEEHKHINGQDEIVKSNKTVAIKFVPEAKSSQAESSQARSSQAEREFEMLTYLNAYKMPAVEKYGIPTVYYHGKWGTITLIALTKLDSDMIDIANSEHKLKNPLDVLILMRDFIVQLKYIHSCGVRHNNIKPTNIMVQGHKSYLIDFNMGTKMLEDNPSGTVEYAARRLHRQERRLAIDDLESYFYSICHVLGCHFPWLNPALYEKSLKERYQITAGFKSRTAKILTFINQCISDVVLKTIICEFADEIYAFPPKAFPDYNRLFELIDRQIVKLHDKETTILSIFSWLSNAEKLKAIHEINSQPPLNIRCIAEPSSINFTTFAYPAV